MCARCLHVQNKTIFIVDLPNKFLSMIIIHELIIKHIPQAILVKPLLWPSRLCTQTHMMLVNNANRLKNCTCGLHPL